MTGQFSPEIETISRLDLGSLPQAGIAVVFGAGGGIGGALVETLRAAKKFDHAVAFSRGTSPSIDLMDESSLERAAAFASDLDEPRLVTDATGFLHDDRQAPEKGWRQRNVVNLARSFALNAIVPQCRRALALSRRVPYITHSPEPHRGASMHGARHRRRLRRENPQPVRAGVARGPARPESQPR